MKKLLETFIRHSLQENASNDYLAYIDRENACVFDKTAFIDCIDNAAFLDLDVDRNYDIIKQQVNDAMLGMISIDRPSGACNGAWEVKASAVKNKGFGKVIYDLAYWMSPTHKLISDRSAMSRQSINGWIVASKSTLQNKEDLDDISNPQNSDPNDDCAVWSGDDKGQIKAWNNRNSDVLPKSAANVLNASYQKDNFLYDWDTIDKTTKKYMSSALSISTKSSIVRIINDAADDLFNDRLLVDI